MKLVTLIESLRADKVGPAYLFHGPERFLIDRAVKRLKEVVLTSAMSDFNLHELMGGSATGDTVVNQARQIPMMASKSLVIVDAADKMSAEVTQLETGPPDAEETESVSRLSRVFGDRVVSEKPLDEVVLDYLVENARKRKRSSK